MGGSCASRTHRACCCCIPRGLSRIDAGDALHSTAPFLHNTLLLCFAVEILTSHLSSCLRDLFYVHYQPFTQMCTYALCSSLPCFSFVSLMCLLSTWRAGGLTVCCAGDAGAWTVVATRTVLRPWHRSVMVHLCAVKIHMAYAY